MDKVCFDCSERHYACWSGCEKYKAAKEKFLKKKKAINADRYMDSAIKTVQYNGLSRKGKER